MRNRVVLPSLSAYGQYMYHWISSPEHCSLPACCSVPHTSVPFLTVRFAEGRIHSSPCSGLWAVAQTPSLNVEVGAEGMVVPYSLLVTISAVPELVEGSRTGPWLLCGRWAFTGSNSAYLCQQAKSQTRLQRPGLLSHLAISSYIQLRNSAIMS